MGVEIHIEQLVLHGFASADRHRIAAAVERELARLIQKNGLSAPGHARIHLDRVPAGAFQVKPGAKPEATGSQIAQALFKSLPLQSSPFAKAPRSARPAAGRQP
jgi:hypothetical protein